MGEKSVKIREKPKYFISKSDLLKIPGTGFKTLECKAFWFTLYDIGRYFFIYTDSLSSLDYLCIALTMYMLQDNCVENRAVPDTGFEADTRYPVFKVAVYRISGRMTSLQKA